MAYPKLMIWALLFLGPQLIFAQHTFEAPENNQELSSQAAPPLLQYSHLEERDVFWETRIWRDIIVAEKANQHFSAIDQELIAALIKAAEHGEITLYHPIDDRFMEPLCPADRKAILGETDTTTVIDPETLEEEHIAIYTPLNYQNIVAYRLKEVWYFDLQRGKLDVRILGLAPIVEEYGEDGEFLARRPLFWAYYPDARQALAKSRSYTPYNTPMSWADALDARFFSSLIIKQSNLQDRRIEDYAEGMQALLEAEKIQEKIRNFEHDLWTY